MIERVDSNLFAQPPDRSKRRVLHYRADRAARASLAQSAEVFDQLPGSGIIFGMTDGGLVVGVRRVPPAEEFVDETYTALASDLKVKSPQDILITHFARDQVRVREGNLRATDSVRDLPSANFIDELSRYGGVPDEELAERVRARYLSPLRFYRRTGGLHIAIAPNYSTAGGRTVYPLKKF